MIRPTYAPPRPVVWALWLAALVGAAFAHRSGHEAVAFALVHLAGSFSRDAFGRRRVTETAWEGAS